jgi:VanZ family protein
LIPRRWWPPVLWLGAIFTATSIPSAYLPETEIRWGDKAVHFFMYGVLGLLITRAMHNPPRTTRLRVALAGFLLVSAFGALDEWHQQYIEGRASDFADWMADTAGGLVGAAAWGERLKAKRPT